MKSSKGRSTFGSNGTTEDFITDEHMSEGFFSSVGCAKGISQNVGASPADPVLVFVPGKDKRVEVFDEEETVKCDVDAMIAQHFSEESTAGLPEAEVEEEETAQCINYPISGNYLDLKAVEAEAEAEENVIQDEVTVKCDVNKITGEHAAITTTDEFTEKSADEEVTVQCDIREITDEMLSRGARESRVKEPSKKNNAENSAGGQEYGTGLSVGDRRFSDDALAKSRQVKPADPAGRPSQASSPFADARSRRHQKMSLAWKKGMSAWQKGNTDEAIQEFNAVANDAKHVVSCQMMLGVCYVRKRQIPRAIKHFKQGLSSNGISRSEKMALCYKLGRSYEYLKMNAQALLYYQSVLKSGSNYKDTKQRIRLLEQIK